MVCPNCGADTRPDASHCTQCGADLTGRRSLPYCPQCGSALQPGDAFCPKCGSQVSDASGSGFSYTDSTGSGFSYTGGAGSAYTSAQTQKPSGLAAMWHSTRGKLILISLAVLAAVIIISIIGIASSASQPSATDLSELLSAPDPGSALEIVASNPEPYGALLEEMSVRGADCSWWTYDQWGQASAEQKMEASAWATSCTLSAAGVQYNMNKAEGVFGFLSSMSHMTNTLDYGLSGGNLSISDIVAVAMDEGYVP